MRSVAGDWFVLLDSCGATLVSRPRFLVGTLSTGTLFHIIIYYKLYIIILAFMFSLKLPFDPFDPGGVKTS